MNYCLLAAPSNDQPAAAAGGDAAGAAAAIPDQDPDAVAAVLERPGMIESLRQTIGLPPGQELPPDMKPFLELMAQEILREEQVQQHETESMKKTHFPDRVPPGISMRAGMVEKLADALCDCKL